MFVKPVNSGASRIYTAFCQISKKKTHRYISLTGTDNCYSRLCKNIQFEKSNHSVFWCLRNWFELSFFPKALRSSFGQTACFTIYIYTHYGMKREKCEGNIQGKSLAYRTYSLRCRRCNGELLFEITIPVLFI